jgi:hypothetical protein
VKAERDDTLAAAKEAAVLNPATQIAPAQLESLRRAGRRRSMRGVRA